MISPPATPTGGLVRQQRLQPSPFLVGQVMAIKHKQDLPHPPTEIHGTRPSGGLSKRELEVARLVTAGLSNKDIAKRLFLSERTVESHVNHSMSKLGVHSRSQVAAWVTEQGLTAQPRY